jgi:TorA maturation chaperone TorD
VEGQQRKPESVPRTLPEEDVLRARFYALLARLLAAPPDADLLETLRRLDADGSEIGRAFGRLAEAAAQTSLRSAEAEFNALFVGMGTGGEVNPYGSFHLTGFSYEKPLAALRGDMARLGIAVGGTGEPEDHVALVCEMMHGLIVGAFGEPADAVTQRAFFDSHLAPWARKFFSQLEKAPSARLYAPVGSLGRLFVALEGEAFSMAA